MLRLFYLLMLVGLTSVFVKAQSCQPDTSLASLGDGIYPDSLTLTGCQFFDTTINFIFPRDTVVSFGGATFSIPFVDFVFDGVQGLPDGIEWECNLAPSCRYVVHPDSNQIDTLGCLRLFGSTSIPGPYNVLVNVTGRVDILGTITSELVTFPFPLTILPCSFEGDCYTLDFSSNCEPAELTITNNLPSQGKPGFDYQWSLSGPNGFSYQTSDENPFAQTLTEAGEYVMEFEASVDTVGFILNGMSIDAVGCSDLLDAGDLYWILLDPDGNEIVNTSANPVSNGGNSLPIDVGLTGLSLDTGIYEFQVWDFDNLGADDGCATGEGGEGASLFFDIPSSQLGSRTLTSGSLQITINLSNPIQTVSCQDTFRIDPLPTLPSFFLDGSLVNEDSLVFCAGSSLLLYTDSQDSVQWFSEEGILVGGQGDSLLVDQANGYFVEVIDPQSLCRVSSRSIRVDSFEVLPPDLQIDPSTEILSVINPSDSVAYFWVDANGNEVAQGTSFEPDTNGLFFAFAIDNLNQCQSELSDGFNFVSDLAEVPVSLSFSLYPNPSKGNFSLKANLPAASKVVLSIYDLAGRQVWKQNLGLQSGAFESDIQPASLTPGIYLVKVNTDSQVGQERLIVNP